MSLSSFPKSLDIKITDSFMAIDVHNFLLPSVVAIVGAPDQNFDMEAIFLK